MRFYSLYVTIIGNIQSEQNFLEGILGFLNLRMMKQVFLFLYQVESVLTIKKC